MSAFDDLQMFYKKQPTPKGEIKDPWALGHYLAEKFGNHTQAEYSGALQRKAGSKAWNPISSEYTAKRAAQKKKKEGDAKEEKKDKSSTTGRKKSSGRQASMLPRMRRAGYKEPAGTKKSLDDFIDILNIIKAEDEKKPDIKEDPKDEHEDKEPIRDPFAVATWRAEREGHDLSTDEGKDRRNEIVDDIKEEGNVAKPKKDDEDIEKSEALQKISPSLAGLMAAAAGWALSDSIVEAGGGTPRGNMTPQQLREWERTVRRSMRKKDASLDKAAWENLQKNYFDSSDLYFRRVPLPNGINISKDHAPVPPRQGLQWDELKKKWVSPDHLGKTVIEVQGKKRIRGSGTGVHEHALHAGGIGGKGEGSGVAGRRFRGVNDAGVLNPHESKHVGGYNRRTSASSKHSGATGSVASKLSRLAHSGSKQRRELAERASKIRTAPKAGSPKARS